MARDGLRIAAVVGVCEERERPIGRVELEDLSDPALARRREPGARPVDGERGDRAELSFVRAELDGRSEIGGKPDDLRGCDDDQKAASVRTRRQHRGQALDRHGGDLCGEVDLGDSQVGVGADRGDVLGVEEADAVHRALMGVDRREARLVGRVRFDDGRRRDLAALHVGERVQERARDGVRGRGRSCVELIRSSHPVRLPRGSRRVGRVGRQLLVAGPSADRHPRGARGRVVSGVRKLQLQPLLPLKLKSVV